MTSGPHVLVVDDDPHILEVVRYALEQASYRVEQARGGREALEQFEKLKPNLVVLDISMPDLDGIEVCRKIRHGDQTPIVFLSSRADELDRVLGLEIGADDYITKPFSPRELVARVKAVLRRSQAPQTEDTQASANVVAHGALQLDLNKFRCMANGTEVILTVTEFELLQAFLEAPGRVYTRDALVNRVYGEGHAITDRTVDSHIRRLRKKLRTHDLDPIETVYGVGYRLREHAQAQ